MDETRLSLLIRVRDSGDQASWQEFYQLYHPLLLRFVKARGISNDNDADDIVQELLISLVRRLRDLDFDKQRGKFRTYLWQSAHNGIIDWIRKNRRHQNLQSLDCDSRVEELKQQSQEDPGQEFVDDLRRQILATALPRLRAEVKPEVWDRFDLHYLQGLSAKSVGERLGCSEGAVFTSVHRLRERLKDICAEYLEDFSA